MKNKILYVILGVLVIAAVAYALSKGKGYSPQGEYTPLPQGTVETSTLQTPSAETSTPEAPQAKTSYTLAEVSAHNSKASCWAVVNGNVYDLTSWISRHPGGEKAILSICGKDGSAEFNGQHGGESRPESMLATFKIGTLAN